MPTLPPVSRELSWMMAPPLGRALRLLAREPVGSVEKIYRHFGWPGFEAMKPALAAYRDAHAGYRTNSFRVADESEQERLRAALA